ncbi:hypothetical protein NKR23_g5469 [Pleurostoma richardsiae]|uniref:MARVEL domain-containing protein n=1 Tax=Pleurostoma richardsiae TaxID=41990 RepID=A0AA38RPA7_9PEZI|nr:hypothetical protein NKR23_g5469 [Pleurostoma richardsiae]
MAINARGNFWALKPDDGRDRTHIPPQALWIFFLRIAQLALAIIVVGLTGYAADTFDNTFNSLGYSFFVFAWTVVYLAWLLISIFFFPIAYHPWAHLAVDIVTGIFWLACWADLAHDASNLDNAEDYYDNYVPYSYRGSGYGRIKRAINCVKAAAAIGALEWVLFVISTIFLVLAILGHRRSQTSVPAAESKPVQMAPVGGGPPPQQQTYPENQQGYYAPQNGYGQQQQPGQAPYQQQPYPNQEQPAPQQQQQQQPPYQQQAHPVAPYPET